MRPSLRAASLVASLAACICARPAAAYEGDAARVDIYLAQVQAGFTTEQDPSDDKALAAIVKARARFAEVGNDSAAYAKALAKAVKDCGPAIALSDGVGNQLDAFIADLTATITAETDGTGNAVDGLSDAKLKKRAAGQVKSAGKLSVKAGKAKTRTKKSGFLAQAMKKNRSAQTLIAGVAPASDWFRDGDLDTWGNSELRVRASGQPAGFTSNGSDCQDNDPDINPDAVENPVNGQDDDCDGNIDG